MLPSGLVNLACRRTWHTFPRAQQDDLCIEILQTKSWVTAVTTTLQSDFTGSQPWEGARTLSSFLASEKRELFLSGNHLSGNNSRVSVVELGSGCGIVGITAAALGANAVLTDQKPQLLGMPSPILTRILQKNVDINQGLKIDVEKLGIDINQSIIVENVKTH